LSGAANHEANHSVTRGALAAHIASARQPIRLVVAFDPHRLCRRMDFRRRNDAFILFSGRVNLTRQIKGAGSMRTAIAAVLLFSGCAMADPCEAPLPHAGERFSGRVTWIIDGDGFCVGEAQGGVEVRTEDFYACELSEPGGEAAKQIAHDLLYGKNVDCIASHKSYDRIVATCTVGGVKVGDLMRAHHACEGGRGFKPR
jgi:hypothetical protein